MVIIGSGWMSNVHAVGGHRLGIVFGEVFLG